MHKFSLVPFHPGEIVTRRANVYDKDSPIMYGRIMRRYSTHILDSDKFLYPEKELYEVFWFNYYNVWWDNIGPHVSRGYFRHGLNPLH